MAETTLTATLKLNDQMTVQLARVRRSVSATARKMAAGFRRATRSVFNLRNALAVVATAGAAKLAADFETSMSRIVGLVGLAEDEVAGFSDQILKLGTEVAQGPRELAEALFFITSAGLRGKDAMDALTASAKAASAGLGKTKQVADAVTSAMNAYGIETLSAEQATAILVATVREGKVEADSLAGALGRVLPVASELGVSFDQVGAAIAAMTRLGLNADEATTALRSVMAALIKPAKAGADALEEVGLSFAGLRTQLREEGLLQVLLTLRERLGDNEEALAKVIPNVRGLTGVLNLVGANAAQAQAIFASLAKTTGADLARAFDAARKTAAFGFGQVRAVLEVLIIKFGEFVNAVGKAGVFDFLREVLKGIAGNLDDVTDNGERAAAWARGFITVIKGVALTVAGAADAMNLLLTPFRIFSELQTELDLREINKAIQDLEGGLQRVTEAGGKAVIGIRNVTGSTNAQANALLNAARQTKLNRQELTQLIGSLKGVVEGINRRRKAQEESAEATAKEGGLITKLLVIIDAAEKKIAAQAAAREAAAKAAGRQFTAEQALLGPLLASLEVTAKRAAADKARVEASNALLSPLLRQIAADAAAAVEARKAATSVFLLARSMRSAVPSSEDLAARMAALPPELFATLEGLEGVSAQLEKLKVLEKQVKFDELRAKMSAVELQAERMQASLQGGFSALGAAVQEFNRGVAQSSEEAALAASQIWLNFLKSSTLDAVAAAQFMVGTIKAFAGAVAEFVGKVIDKAFAGQIRTIKDVGKAAQEVLQSLIKQIIQELVRLAVQTAVTRAIIGAGAQGAVVQGGLSGIPAFQAGGIITGPGLFVAGEGGQREAVVPLPDGRSIPIMDVGDGGGGGGGVTNNITIFAMDSEDVVRTLSRPEAQEVITGGVAGRIRTDSDFRTEINGAV